MSNQRLAAFIRNVTLARVGYAFQNYADEFEWVSNNLPKTKAQFKKVFDVCGGCMVDEAMAAAILLGTTTYNGKVCSRDSRGAVVPDIWQAWLKPEKKAKQKPVCSVCGTPAVGVSNFGGWRCSNHYDDAS